jgi:hypothetical protein
MRRRKGKERIRKISIRNTSVEVQESKKKIS